MKIRIKGNSLRLRLAQEEVETFRRFGRVANTIRFGFDETEILTYELVRSNNHDTVTADFNGGEISVYVPRPTAEKWTGSEDTGFKAKQVTGEGNHLIILIEKDFQCLHKRAGEHEADLYLHPAARKSVVQPEG